MEKLNFPNIYSAEESGQPIEEQFKHLHKDYIEKRNKLDSGKGNEDELESELNFIREEIANLITIIYRESDSLEQFKEKIINLTTEDDNLWVDEINNYINDLYLDPYKRNSNDIPSPIESIWSTIRNIETISKFIKFGNHADGIVLSGSNAYGPFYAPKGEIMGDLVESNIDNEDKYISDIDLLITCGDINQLELIIKDYVTNGLFDNSELDRFKVFKELYLDNKIDSFSALSKVNGTETMVHFLFNNDIKKFSDSNHHEQIEFLRDLRPKIPKSIIKNGYYPLFDLVSGKMKEFRINPEPVNYKNTNDVAGYISKTPFGGIINEEGNKSYYLGHIAFYLVISSILLKDKDKFIAGQANKILEIMKTILGGKMPEYIIRQERMPSRFIKSLNNLFTDDEK